MKDKKSAILTFGGLGDWSYSADQSANSLSQDSPTVSEKNIDSIKNSWEKLT